MFTPKKLWQILLIVAGLLLLLAVLAVGLAQAAPPPTTPAIILDHPAAPRQATGWEDFFSSRMQAYDVPGAVMVMVRGADVIFAQGFGYADLANQTPIDLQTTRLRAGSIAKTLTATAIFQLAEQGRLDLDADVNRYLQEFKVPATFGEPVTARQLINMTAGFDTRAVGIRAHRAEDLPALGDYLARRMPPRVYPPGVVRRYNDHEVALAGYLVEAVSGQSYEQYVRQHIFEPLEMEASSVLLPDELLSQAARGYPVDGGAGQAYPLSYYYLKDAPGSGFNTTAEDMAHYLVAHLNLGRYTRSDGSQLRILQESTAREMQRTAFAYGPGMPGQANTFDELFYKGQRYLRKRGGAPGMQNSLLLLGDQGLAFYLFYNSEGSALVREWEAEIASRYLDRPTGGSPAAQPASLPGVQSAATGMASSESARYAGQYMQISDYTSFTTIVQLRALFESDVWVTVTANPDGTLNVWGRRYQALAEGVYVDPASGERIKFSPSSGSLPGLLFVNRTAYQRTPDWRTPPVQLGLLGVAVLLSLAGLSWFAWAGLRRRAARLRLAALLAALNLAFLGWLVIVLLPVATGGDVWQFSFDPSLALRAVLVLPLANLLLAALLLVRTWKEWRSLGLGWGVGLHRSLVLVSTALLVVFLDTWNLLGWRF